MEKDEYEDSQELITLMAFLTLYYIASIIGESEIAKTITTKKFSFLV